MKDTMKYIAFLSLLGALASTPAFAEEPADRGALQGAPESAAAPTENGKIPLGFSTNPEAEPHYRKALGLVDDYRGLTFAGVETAKKEFQQGLALEPENQLARLMWARVMLRLTGYELSPEAAARVEDEARAILANLDLSGEDGLVIRKERASAYLYELQDLALAEEDLAYLAEHGEHDPQVLLALGQTRFYAEKYFAAKQSFRQALALDPGNLEALNNVGWCELRDGDFDEAARSFEQVLGSDETHMGSLLGMAKVHQERGELGEAIEKYGKLLEISPNFVYFLDLMILYFRNYSAVFWVLGLIIAGIFARSLWQTVVRDKQRAATSIKIAREHGAGGSGGGGDA